MKECRHFNKFMEVDDDLKNLKYSHKSLVSSVKSLHRRQDKSDEMREKLVNQTNNLNIVVHDLDLKLQNHMEWEENMVNINNINTEKNIAMFKWIAGFVILGLLSFSGYTLKVISNTDKSALVNKKHLETVDTSLDEIKQLIINK